MPAVRKTDITFALIFITYSVYAASFIYRTSFVIDGMRYYSLFDDAMISMRYAENLVEGYGLVWNPGGERVEGFTNPLWVLYMSIFHLFPIASSKISLFIQMSGALFLMANLIFVKKIADLIADHATFFSFSAVLLTAFYLPLNNWSLQGMEVSVLTLLISISILKTLQSIKREKFSFWPYILLGVGTVVRMDMVIPYLAIWLFLSFADPKNRGKNFAYGLLILLSFILVQTIFRIWYYGEVLPNTFYLKMTGYPILLRIGRGFVVTYQFISRMSVLVFLIPFSLLFFRRDKFILTLFVVFLAQMAYSIYVGGDAWEYWGGSNRYVSIVMPIFFILFCGSLAAFEKRLLKNVNRTKSFAKVWPRFITIVILLISIVKFNVIYSPYATLQEWLLLKPPLAVTDNEEMVKSGLLLKEITDPEAKVAVVWAGAIPYFSGRQSVDLLGKNDKTIARMDACVPEGPGEYTAFYPGHLKWNYDYSIEELKPDVIAQLYGVETEEIEPYLEVDYCKVLIEGFVLHLRVESNWINWEKVEILRSVM